MAAPTATSVNEDLHKVELEVRELSTQVKGVLTSVKLLAVLGIGTLGSSIWWGATLTADVRNLGARVDERFQAQRDRSDEKFRAVDARFDKLEASMNARFEKLEGSMNARFEKLEGSIVRAIERTRPDPK